MLILTLVAMPAFAQKVGQIHSQDRVIPVYDSEHERLGRRQQEFQPSLFRCR